MLQLGSILHSQGFSVKVAHTEFNTPNYSSHTEFVFLPMEDGLQGIDMSFPSLENVYFMNKNCKMLDPLPELHSLRCKDVPFPVINNTFPELILEFCRAMSYIGSSIATIWNTMQDLENSLLVLQEHDKVPFFPIGPFHKMAPMASSTSIIEEDNSCIEWLDRQAPGSVLYVSFGSLVRIDDKELTETAWGLANSDQPFLWVIRPGSVSGCQCAESLPDGFEKMVVERGLIVKWAPQKQVLAHPAVAGFFTHCGWNSTLESILEEVPLICRPAIADQPVNARYLSQIYKVGFELEVIERTVIEKTVRKLMLSEEGKDLKKRVIDMKKT
ncbi:unnamed protein product [Withania somnifera]